MYDARGGMLATVVMPAQSRIRMSPTSDSRTGVVARIGSRFGSPFVLAISVLGLVLTVGAAATLSTYASLCRAGRERARSDLQTQSSRLRASLAAAFDLSDALLDRLAPHVRELGPTAELEPLLRALLELSTARPGLAWMSMSFEDGTFVGVFRDPDGSLRAQESRVTNLGGVERQLTPTARGTFVETLQRPTEYDPRTRPFYRLARREGARVWTPAYPFLPTLRTGVTRADPVYRTTPEGREMVGVATVDFDATALAELLVDAGFRSQKLLVVTSDGALVASHGVALPESSSLSRDHALSVETLSDPVLSRIVEARSRLLRGEGEILEVEGRRLYVDAVDVGRLGASGVTLFSAVDESELYAEANAEAQRGMGLTAIVALLALALAAALSANIARLRRSRARAEHEAEMAREEVRALGSYELCELLGSGGMGDVYRAKHRLLARDAALKLMRLRENGDDVALRELFKKEAQRLSSMRSIHTVSVYDFGIASDGSYYLVMELLDGLDLDALVRRDGPQPAARVAAILAQICDSLAEAHAAGLVHQDIKPANVFLCRLAEALDVVKVLDFGIARMIEARTSLVPTREGTPAFMSPEQVLGEPVGPASDLYALGCVGYFLLAGRPPYQGSRAEELGLLHVEAELPQLPRGVREATPSALSQLLIRCLAKLPSNRPSSAAVLGDAFRKIAREHAQTFTETMRQDFWRRFDDAAGSLRVSRAAPAPEKTRTLPARVYSAEPMRGRR